MKNIYRHIIILSALISLSSSLLSGQEIENNLIVSVQNYPNPFNPSTQIQFVLSQDADVSVKIYNILGKEIRTLAENKSMSAGRHSAEWDGKDKNGIVVPSGMYLYQVNAGNSILTKKMSLLK